MSEDRGALEGVWGDRGTSGVLGRAHARTRRLAVLVGGWGLGGARRGWERGCGGTKA